MKQVPALVASVVLSLIGLPLAAQTLNAVTLDAAFVAQNVPATMTAGQSYAVNVTMRNAGTNAWTANISQLGSQNPADNKTWGTNRVILPTAVASGQNYTFNFTVKAPAAPGNYNFQWRMVLGSTWFGATSPNVQVTVGSGSPTPSPSVTPSPTGTPRPTPSTTPRPTPTPRSTPTPTPTATGTPKPSPTPTATATGTPRPTPTTTPRPTPTPRARL